MSGNLSYQVEHHLYPDLPSSRYQEIAPKVKDICERYELPYNTGPFSKQWGSVQRTIVRLAFPGGKTRKKAPPYKAPAKQSRERERLEQRPRRAAAGRASPGRLPVGSGPGAAVGRFTRAVWRRGGGRHRGHSLGVVRPVASPCGRRANGQPYPLGSLAARLRSSTPLAWERGRDRDGGVFS